MCEAGENVQGDGAAMQELRRRVRGLEERCEAERRQTELAQRERERMKEELLQAQEQVYMLYHTTRVDDPFLYKRSGRRNLSRVKLRFLSIILQYIAFP